MKKRVAMSFFLSHPIQYISPLLVAMAKEFDLKVYYFSDANLKGDTDKEFGQVIKWDVPLLQGYQYTFIKNNSPRPGLTNGFFNLVNFGLIKRLRSDKAEVVIVNGWGYFSTILTIIVARMLGKKVWVRGENPLSQELMKSGKLRFLKNVMLKQFLFRFVNKFLYIGKESKKFFEFYGARSNELVYTPYCVNNDFFNERYEALRSDITRLKSNMRLPAGKSVILFSGKYIDKKRPLDLIRAFEQLGDPTTALVMVGEGELRNEMERYISGHNIQDVYLTGFVNQSKIPEYYAVADIFVMCSGEGETWGLSVNEAMNFAKPVVVTATTGCSADLVRNGENGFIVEEGNILQLTEALRTLLQNDALRKSAGLLSKEIIKDYSIDEIIKHLKAAF